MVKAIKLKKKHPIGRRYRVVKSKLSSKKTSSTPKRSRPKSNSIIPALVGFDSLLRVTMLNDYAIKPISFTCSVECFDAIKVLEKRPCPL